MPPRRRNRGRNEGENEIPRGERENLPPPPRAIEELFLRQNPPSFNGIGSPVDAELWVRSMERIFDFLRCTAQERLSCVAFQLNGAADFWWEAKRKTMTPEQLENFSWEDFKTGIYEKYIPKSYRRKKETEFFHLKQEKMSVTEYDRVFCDMSRYAMQQVDTDAKMSEKFCSGLRYEIRMSLAGHGALSYSEALSRALDIEAAMPEEKQIPAQAQQSGDKGKRKWEGNPSDDSQGNYGNQREKRLWQGDETPQGRGQGQVRQAIPGQFGNSPRVPPCSKCHRMHLGPCQIGSYGCYKCGQQGHFARQCPGQMQGGGIVRTGQPSQAQPLRAIQGYVPPQFQQQQPQQQRGPQFPQARAFGLQQYQPEQNQGNLASMRKFEDICYLIV